MSNTPKRNTNPEYCRTYPRVLGTATTFDIDFEDQSIPVDKSRSVKEIWLIVTAFDVYRDERVKMHWADYKGMRVQIGHMGDILSPNFWEAHGYTWIDCNEVCAWRTV